MEKLHIDCKTLDEKIEAIKLLEVMGCYNWGIDDEFLRLRVYESGDIQSVATFSLSLREGSKEITLPELRDMVVLKRNDVNDATHTGDHGSMWYLGDAKYGWRFDLKKWELDDPKNKIINFGELKPIEKEMTETEYLMQGENGEHLMESVGQLRGGEAKQETKSISDTLAERQSTYGSFEDVAFVTEGIMAVLSKVRPNGLNDLPQTHRMALYMIASKMARIVNGDFNHKDSWHDIGGYAKLIDDLIGESE